MPNSDSPVLILFMKYPELGQVKTRLAASLGEEKTLALYERMLARTLEQTLVLSDEGWTRIYCLTPDEKAPELKSRFPFLTKDALIYSQGDGDLGQRLKRSFEQASVNYSGPFLVIGCDCLDLTLERLQQAKEALEESDVCFYPAQDGGYTLMGLSRSGFEKAAKAKHPQWGSAISWSSDQTLRQSINGLESAGLSVSLLDPKMVDLDTLEALKAHPEASTWL